MVGNDQKISFILMYSPTSHLSSRKLCVLHKTLRQVAIENDGQPLWEYRQRHLPKILLRVHVDPGVIV